MSLPTLASSRRRRCALAAIAVCLGSSIASVGPAQAARPALRTAAAPRRRMLLVAVRSLRCHRSSLTSSPLVLPIVYYKFKCLRARGVTRRPRGVRSMKPICSKYGS